MKTARRVFAFALILLLSSLLFLSSPAVSPYDASTPASPAPGEARLDEVGRAPGDVIMPTITAYTPKDAPSRHPAKLIMVLLLCLVCLLLCALRAVCAHVPPHVRVHSLRGQIGHPHHAPPFFA